MTDYANLFTAPDAKQYGTDPLEALLTQESTTNPFALAHAVAARNNAAPGRARYSQDLQNFNQFAFDKQTALGQQDAQNSGVKALIDKGAIAPTSAMQALMRPLDNSPQNQDSDQLWKEGLRNKALLDLSSGVKNMADSNYQMSGMEQLMGDAGAGQPSWRPSPAELAASAKATSANKVTYVDTPWRKGDDPGKRQITHEFVSGSPEEAEYLRTNPYAQMISGSEPPPASAPLNAGGKPAPVAAASPPADPARSTTPIQDDTPPLRPGMETPNTPPSAEQQVTTDQLPPAQQDEFRRQIMQLQGSAPDARFVRGTLRVDSQGVASVDVRYTFHDPKTKQKKVMVQKMYIDANGAPLSPGKQ